MQVQCIVKLDLYASSSLTPTRCHTSPLCHRRYQCPGDVFVLATYFTFLCYKAALWITHAFVVLAHIRQWVSNNKPRCRQLSSADRSRRQTYLVGRQYLVGRDCRRTDLVGKQLVGRLGKHHVVGKQSTAGRDVESSTAQADNGKRNDTHNTGRTCRT